MCLASGFFLFSSPRQFCFRLETNTTLVHGWSARASFAGCIRRVDGRTSDVVRLSIVAMRYAKRWSWRDAAWRYGGRKAFWVDWYWHTGRVLHAVWPSETSSIDIIANMLEGRKGLIRRPWRSRRYFCRWRYNDGRRRKTRWVWMPNAGCCLRWPQHLRRRRGKLMLSWS